MQLGHPLPRTKQAFSLVELSIVLVILGLLVGGILSGQSLIRAAELRAVTTEYMRWVTATQTFRDKYFAIPGDMPNATAFWGAAHATAGTCITTVGTGTQTCNGTGDGIISGATPANQYTEMYMFWQHLANAGLIEGSYTGISGAGGAASSANEPRSKLGQGYWQAFNWYTTYTGQTTVFDGTYHDNMLNFSTLTTTVLKPEEAWNIDKKLDDGRPAYGKWRERMWDDCTDASSSADLDSDYALTNTSIVCMPIMWLQ